MSPNVGVDPARSEWAVKPPCTKLPGEPTGSIPLPTSKLRHASLNSLVMLGGRFRIDSK